MVLKILIIIHLVLAITARRTIMKNPGTLFVGTYAGSAYISKKADIRNVLLTDFRDKILNSVTFIPFYGLIILVLIKLTRHDIKNSYIYKDMFPELLIRYYAEEELTFTNIDIMVKTSKRKLEKLNEALKSYSTEKL